MPLFHKIIALLIGIALIALLGTLYGYFHYRGNETTSTRYRFVIASVFSAPLLLFLLLDGVHQVATRWPGLRYSAVTQSLLSYLFVISLWGRIVATSAISIAYHVLVSVFVGFAWLAHRKSRLHKVLLTVYTGVLLFYVGCATLWLLSGQGTVLP